MKSKAFILAVCISAAGIAPEDTTTVGSAVSTIMVIDADADDSLSCASVAVTVIK